MIYLLLLKGIILCDVFTKHFVRKKLPEGEKVEIVKDKFYFWHIKNKGVAYNKLARYPELVICITSAAIGALSICMAMAVKQKEKRVLKFSFACILGGAIGNLIDRVQNKSVTDFIYIQKKRAPIFNIADIFIVLGGLFYFLSSFFSKEK